MDQDLIATPVERMVCSSCSNELEVSGRPAFSSVACPHCGTMLSVPVLLGQFLLVERMGAGGMGAVYRGLDVALNRFVAIKVMKSALGDDAKLVESFIREAQAAATLNHRNIVQIYSCGQEKGQPYIVMELVTGGRLSEMFSRHAPMDEEALLKIALDVTEGLSAAHVVGLVHGDIKPENVLIDGHGTAKIVDFGLAQFVNAQKNRGEIWGTPYYISPERARGNKADHRSDIYSLGATMFHVLTGQPPFDGETPAEVVLARLKHPPPDLKALRPELTDQTVALISRMMAAEPSLRYPTSASLKSDMLAALEAARLARKAMKEKPRPGAGPSLRVLAIAAAFLVVLGSLVFFFGRQGPRVPVAPAPPPVAQPEPEKPPGDEMYSVTMVKGPDGIERPRMEVRLFTPDEEKAIAAAFGRLTGPDVMAAHRELTALARNMPRQSLRAMWMPVLQAIPLWASADRKVADADITDMVGRFKAAQPEQHPIYMPQVLGASLVGKQDAAELARRLDDWPAWFGDLLAFATGVRELARGNFDEGGRLLDRFAGSNHEQPVWVAALAPAARAWRDQLAASRQLQRQADTLLDAGRTDVAVPLLKAFQAQAAPMFAASVKDTMKRAQDVVAGQREAEARNKARRHRITVQEDLLAVDAALAEVSTMVVRSRDYRKAALSISTLPNGMKTEEGRRAAVWLRDVLEQLDKFKTQIALGADRLPFTRSDGSDLGGDVISATSLGVRTTLDGRSVVTREWEGIPLRSMIRMGEFYAGSSRLTGPERAELLTSLALFCLVNGAVEPAAGYARRAVELDPAAAVPVRRLLPGLAPEG